MHWNMGIALKSGGFVPFFVKKYKAYIGRNPKTGEFVKVVPKKLPFFKVGKVLKDRVDG
jgi:integration host factor subunit beta